MRYIGQPIVAHHKNGTVHRGILHAVTPEGMYIRYGSGYASADQVNNNVSHLDLECREEDIEVESVFFGLGFLPWFGLAGFWGGGFWW